MSKLVLGVVLLFFVVSGCLAQESEAQIEERLVSYQKCRIDNDCLENSFCYDNDNDRIGLCKCQQSFELLIRNRTYYTCKKLAIWNEACEIDQQCVDNLGSLGRCNEVCGCAEGSFRYHRDGRCYKSVLLDDLCRTDANCILEDGTYAFCTDGSCECNIGFTPSEDRKRCIPARNIGQSCSDNSECSLVANSICREVCRCNVGFVISRDGSACLRAAMYFFDSCDENDQCSEFLHDSVCMNGNCTCQQGFHGYKTQCVRSAQIGQACSSQEQCLRTSDQKSVADCIEGVCTCLSDYEDPLGELNCRSMSVTIYINFSSILLMIVCSLIT